MCRFVTRWGGPGEIEACSYEHYFLQCFDTVGWVIWPAKTVPEMTYNVFSGTLNPTHFTSVQRDLRAYNLTLNEAVDLAQNRPLWRLMSTYGAMHS